MAFENKEPLSAFYDTTIKVTGVVLELLWTKHPFLSSNNVMFYGISLFMSRWSN